jgi:pSer/pThr/pTyr-binding forkhead associated (FHA) protein
MGQSTSKGTPDLAATQRIFPVLTVFRDAAEVASVALDKRCITIGRSSENDICLDDAGVSRLHAQIVTVLGESVVEDHDSRNGTFVNGKWIKARQLAPGDTIIIAGFRLIYQYVPDESADQVGDLMRRWRRGVDGHDEARRCAACGQSLPPPAGVDDDSTNTILL